MGTEVEKKKHENYQQKKKELGMHAVVILTPFGWNNTLIINVQ